MTALGAGVADCVPEELEDAVVEVVSDVVPVVEVALWATTGEAVAVAAVSAVASVPEPPPHAANKTAAQAQDKAVIEKRWIDARDKTVPFQNDWLLKCSRASVSSEHCCVEMVPGNI